MRGGKRGSHKGRERILVENEDDIIARNMMVACALRLSNGQEREESKRKYSGDEEDMEKNSTESSEADESVEEPDREKADEEAPAQPVWLGSQSKLQVFEKSKPIQIAVFENGNLNRGAVLSVCVYHKLGKAQAL